LTYVAADPAFRVSDLMAIAAMLYPDGVDEQVLGGQCAECVHGFALYLFEAWEEERAPAFFAGASTLGASIACPPVMDRS
jgi:type IV secretion system protein VirD4